MIKNNTKLQELRKSNKVEKVQKNFYIEKKHAEKLDILKEETGRNLSELIGIALTEFMEKFEFKRKSQNSKNGDDINA